VSVADDGPPRDSADIWPAEFHPRVILVTGGAGFIGANLIRSLLKGDPNLHVVSVDALTYAGRLENLADVARRHGPLGDGRYRFIHADIRDRDAMAEVLFAATEPDRGAPPRAPDAVFHLAAESHVDRSIADAGTFVSTNVQGTQVLLECTRAELSARPRPFRFVNVSTDEVYGALRASDAAFTEEHPLLPNSPYSATKAAADCLVRAYRETFGLPCLTVRSSNVFGPYQHPEKLIPRMITRALRDEPLPLFGDGRYVRDWLYVNDHVSALWSVCTRGDVDVGVYNVGGESELENIDVIRAVLALLGKPESLIAYVPDRPGHDRRYATNIGRIRETLGWSPTRSFDVGLAETVRWYVDHRSWWEGAVSRD
jgi:dTDP-glucose 4,6-dehydratase